LWLKQKTEDFEIIQYFKAGITIEELTNLFKMLDKKPFDMVRKQEKVYKELYKKRTFSDEEWIEIISNNLKLLNRPIITKGKKAVWGDPAESIDELF